MREITCTQCGGSGIERRGSVVAPVDPDYDFSQGFANMGASESMKQECAQRAKAFMLTVQPGDRIESSGQYTALVLDVGMYDGWPFWKPTPAVLKESPLGGAGDWEFYYNITRVIPDRVSK